MPRMKVLRRDQFVLLADFAEQIEAELDEVKGDSLALHEARRHAGRLKAWLGELSYLTEVPNETTAP